MHILILDMLATHVTDRDYIFIQKSTVKDLHKWSCKTPRNLTLTLLLPLCFRSWCLITGASILTLKSLASVGVQFCTHWTWGSLSCSERQVEKIALSLQLSRAFSHPTWFISLIFSSSHSLVSQVTSKVHHTLLLFLLLLHTFYFTACLVLQYRFQS